jgi:CHRD domain-containing protein
MTRRFWLRSTVAVALTAGLAGALMQPRSLRADVVPGRTVVAYALANGSEEAPTPIDSKGTAFGRFVLNQDRTKLLYEIRWSGLTGDATAMHLHAGVRGKPGSVVVPFQLDAPASGEAIGEVDNIPPAVADAFINQGLYLNIHTKVNPGGEIRGQVILAP